MTQRLQNYVRFIRPLLMKADNCEEDYLFLNLNGKRISKIGII